MHPDTPSGKTAVICMGGGMRSAYGAGFLYALGKELGLTPHIIVGTSGDAGNVLYFAARQFESARRVWCDLIATRRFISFLRPWKIIDIDYLVDSIIKKQEPLNVEALASSSVEWFIPLTDVDTGETKYMSASDNADPFEILRAAKAIPFFFGRYITLLGHRFIDGEIGPSLEDHARFVIEKGANRILILNNGRVDHGLIRYTKWLFAELEPAHVKEKMLQELAVRQHVCFTGPEGVDVICVFPGTLPVGFVSINKNALSATFDRGIEKAIALSEELRRLFT